MRPAAPSSHSVSPRRINARRIVDQLSRARALSRAELAGQTGLSAPTVGKVADALLAAGVLEEQGPMAESSRGAVGEEPALGRPARPLRLERRTPRFMALQLGVHHTRLSALPVAGAMDERWPVCFATPRRAATWRRRLAAAAKDVALTRPWAVLVSVPGVVDERAQSVLLSPNLHWTERADLAALVREVWDAPVVLMQEIRALALGHLTAISEASPPRDFLLVDFGDGIGGALVRDGQLYEGALPLSGELGHTPVAGNDRACGCGAIGCMETLASRQGLLQSWAASKGRSRRQGWRTLVRHVQRHGVEPWLREAVEAAACVIAGAMNVVGVNHLVVTGAMTELPESVHETLRDAVQRSVMWARFGTVQVTMAPRCRAAGLVAAGIDRALLPLHGRALVERSALPTDAQAQGVSL